MVFELRVDVELNGGTKIQNLMMRGFSKIVAPLALILGGFLMQGLQGIMGQLHKTKGAPSAKER